MRNERAGMGSQRKRPKTSSLARGDTGTECASACWQEQKRQNFTGDVEDGEAAGLSLGAGNKELGARNL